MAKMTKYQKAKAIALGTFVVPFTGAVILSGAAIHNELSNHGSHPTEPLSDTLKKSGIVAVSDYEEKVKQQSDELYEQLQDEEINSHQFSVRYNQLHSNESLENWAQTSSDPQVKEIVDEYNMKVAKVKEDDDKTTKLMAAAGLSFVLSASSIFIDDLYLHVRNKRKQPANNKFTPLPDPNGKNPTDIFENEDSEELSK